MFIPCADEEMRPCSRDFLSIIITNDWKLFECIRHFVQPLAIQGQYHIANSQHYISWLLGAIFQMTS